MVDCCKACHFYCLDIENAIFLALPVEYLVWTVEQVPIRVIGIASLLLFYIREIVSPKSNHIIGLVCCNQIISGLYKAYVYQADCSLAL